MSGKNPQEWNRDQQDHIGTGFMDEIFKDVFFVREIGKNVRYLLEFFY